MSFKHIKDYVIKLRGGAGNSPDPGETGGSDKKRKVYGTADRDKLLADLDAFIESRYEEPEEDLADEPEESFDFEDELFDSAPKTSFAASMPKESAALEDGYYESAPKPPLAASMPEESFDLEDGYYESAPKPPSMGGAPQTAYRRDARADYDAVMSPFSSFREKRELGASQSMYSAGKTGKPQKSLQDVMKNVGENFREMLLRLIDERGLSDPYVYKRANLDRKLFSKIRCNKDYCPSKKTVLALAIALKLSVDETVDLLSRAGYAFSPCSKTDLIVEFCINNEIYDIYEVDSLLYRYGEPTLG